MTDALKGKMTLTNISGLCPRVAVNMGITIVFPLSLRHCFGVVDC